MRHAVLAVVSNCCPPLKGRLLTRYSPVRHCPQLPLAEASFHRFSFDLHVLGTPPAFVLSQDQTLNKMVLKQLFRVAPITSLSLCFQANTQEFSLAVSLTFPKNNLFVSRKTLQSVQGVSTCFSLFNLQGARSYRGFPLTGEPL